MAQRALPIEHGREDVDNCLFEYNSCFVPISRLRHRNLRLTAVCLSTRLGTVAALSCAAKCESSPRRGNSIETVPYTTNRIRFSMIFPIPHKLERWIAELWFADLKKEIEPKILPPLHPDSVRVRRIASEIVRAAVDLGLADRRGHETVAIMLGASPRSERPRRRLGERLGEKRPETGSLLDGWEVVVVKDDKVKARCVPCGKMLVYTGLLDKLSDAEIAAVFGHEIGHAVARHGVKRRIVETMLCFVMRIITFNLYQGQPLLESFCRKQEKEADRIGLMLLAAAGYHPRGAPLLYEKLGKIVGPNYSSRYHPSCKERAQLLSQPNLMKEAMELYRRVGANK